MYSIYFQYETLSAFNNCDGVSDHSVEFSTLAETRSYFKRLVTRARETSTLLDVVVFHGDQTIYDACYHRDGSVHVRHPQ